MEENPYEAPKIPSESRKRFAWNRELTSKEHWIAAIVTVFVLAGCGLLGMAWFELNQ